MKKRFLLLAAMLLTLMGGVGKINSLNAQETVTINGTNATSNNQYYPFRSRTEMSGNNDYNYNSITQQYYTKSEIIASSPNESIPDGSISKLTFTEKGTEVKNYKYNKVVTIYMKHITAPSVATSWDMNWNDNDIVYQGIPELKNGTLEFILTKPFEYNKENDILIFFDADKGEIDANTTTTGDIKFALFSTGNTIKQSAYGVSTAVNFDPFKSNTYPRFTARNVKNVITLTFSSGGGEPGTPTEPIAPTLISPANGETDVFNQELKFQLNDESEHNIMFNDEVVKEGIYGKPGDVVTYKPQLSYDEETTYYWQVYAANNGLFANSEVCSFTTRKVTAAPGAVSNVSPANNATDQLNPTLSWTFGENTEEYQVLLAEASEDLPEIDNKKWTNTQNAAVGSYTTSGLERGTEYKWQVVTKNFKGETSSDIYTFTTLDIPAAVTPNPANGATGVSKNVTLTWTYADNTVTGYRLLFNNGGGFEYKGGSNWKTPGQDGTDSFEITGLAPNTEYSWCVDVKNAAGTRGMYGCDVEGEVFTFTTVDDISPVTEYEVKLNDGSITLEWQFADQKANEYQVCFGEDEENLEPWHFPFWMSRETAVETTNFVETSSFTFNNPGFGDKVYFRVNVRKDEGETVEGATAFYVIFDEEEPVTWSDTDNNANDVFVRTNVNVETNITAKNVTIENGGILTINGTLKKSKLTINDGGQLIGADKLSGTSATFNMAINKPETWSSENKDGWQFISSPFTNSRLDDFTNGIEGDYDLYKYDASNQTWFNYKEALSHGNAAGTFGAGFYSGIGYLASYQTEETATLTGDLNKEVSFAKSLTYNAENELASIHLLGNPFPFNMNIDKATFTNMVKGFAVVTAEGGYDYSQTTIPVGDGFFVKAVGTNPSLQYDHNSSSKSRNAEQSKSLNIIAAGNAGNDNVVVNLAGEGEGFPKLQNFNDDIATVYVQNNNTNYGIYNCDENTTEIELCFNANQMGNYTISMEPNGNFNSIVLVDRFTGIETNLLVDDYHFTAMSEADNNRFMIKMEAGQQTTDNSQFVYQSGEELIIEAEGTVQIIDVMGRMVYSNDVESNSRINVSDFNNGAYIVRVINEEGVRSQKVVIY